MTVEDFDAKLDQVLGFLVTVELVRVILVEQLVDFVVDQRMEQKRVRGRTRDHRLRVMPADGNVMQADHVNDRPDVVADETGTAARWPLNLILLIFVTRVVIVLVRNFVRLEVVNQMLQAGTIKLIQNEITRAVPRPLFARSFFNANNLR